MPSQRAISYANIGLCPIAVLSRIQRLALIRTKVSNGLSAHQDERKSKKMTGLVGAR